MHYPNGCVNIVTGSGAESPSSVLGKSAKLPRLCHNDAATSKDDLICRVEGDEWGYVPTLSNDPEGGWSVDWISSEGDSILLVASSSAEMAIIKAYNYCEIHNLL